MANDGTVFVTDGSELEEHHANVTSSDTLLRRDGTPVVCFICGANHLKQNCPRYDPNHVPKKSSDVPKKSTDSDEKPKAKAFTTIAGNDDWDDDYEDGAYMFYSPSNIVPDIKTTCFEPDLQDDTEVKYDHILQHSKGAVNPMWMLLDNQSTVNVFYNPRLLRNIRKAPNFLTIYSTGGPTETNLIGDLPGFGVIWFHPKGIANILSLSKVKKKFRITYDSAGSDTFDVHLDGGKVRSFIPSDSGLYFSNIQNPKFVNSCLSNVFVNTVAENKSKYSTQDYLRAVTARKLQSIVGTPSYQEFQNIVSTNRLRNSPIHQADVIAAEDIFGPSLQVLKGKTPRQKTTHVHANNINIPPVILLKYKYITLAADIMFVNGLRFFTSKSRGIKFTTIEYVKNAKADTLFNSMTQIKNVYLQPGLIIDELFVAEKFTLTDSLLLELSSTRAPEMNMFPRWNA